MALLQLVAKGVQDELLVGNPRTSFFRTAYKRHTPFSTEFRDQVFDNEVGFGSRRAVVKIARLGDLLHTCILQMTMRSLELTDDVSLYPFYPAEEFVESVELYIGSEKIETHDHTFFRVYDELYRKEDARLAYRELTDFTTEPAGSVKTLYLPLAFWFCRDPSRALPLVAMAHHEVELVFTFAKSVRGVDPTFAPRPTLICEYVHLDTPERTRLASAPQAMLVEQIQSMSAAVQVLPQQNTVRVDLSQLNHPCKTLAWALTHPERHGVFTGSLRGLENAEAYAPLESAKLVVNGVDRGEVRSGAWNRAVDAFSRINQIPSVGVYTMNFALHPDDATAPSGAVNLSQVEAYLHLTTKRAPPGTTRATIMDDAMETVPESAQLTMLRVYAQTWNQLIVRDGMAALRWLA